MNKTPPELHRIIEELQAGSSRDENFRLLFELYYPRLVRFFAKRGLSADDSLDLIQETFFGIYRGIGSFRRESRFETWLFQVAINAQKKEWRRGAARKRSGCEVPLDDGSVAERSAAGGAMVLDAPGPDAEALRRERSRLVREAIARLPGQMQKCLLLRIDQGLKYRQIGAVLRLSAGTVKGHLFEARRRLQKELGPELDGSLSTLDEEES